MIELTDIATKELISNVQTDEQGNYLVTLPVGKEYAFNVQRAGYLFYSDNYSLKSRVADSVYKKDIPLQPLEVNANIILHNVFFESGSYTLAATSEVELDKVVALMKNNAGLKIMISGFTDNQGKPADNLTLSNNRAKAVVAYLQQKGISLQRLTAKGFGETMPVADNK